MLWFSSECTLLPDIIWCTRVLFNISWGGVQLNLRSTILPWSDHWRTCADDTIWNSWCRNDLFSPDYRRRFINPTWCTIAMPCTTVIWSRTLEKNPTIAACAFKSVHGQTTWGSISCEGGGWRQSVAIEALHDYCSDEQWREDLFALLFLHLVFVTFCCWYFQFCMCVYNILCIPTICYSQLFVTKIEKTFNLTILFLIVQSFRKQ